MSTTPSPVSPSSTTSSPSSTGAAVTPLSTTSTLLFGFLVSSLTIFAIFMMSAIIWNRIVSRRDAIDTMFAMSPRPPRDPQRLHRPTTWDVWVTPERRSSPWLDVKPVAAQECDCPASSPRIARTEQNIPFWRYQPLNRLLPEVTYLFRRPISQASSASRDATMSQVELSDGSNILVSLLISMPRASTQGDHEHCQRLHEMVFATTNVLYHDTAPP